ncbi:class I SAM-dependent methyltransferase [Marinigracilibium pacificum]|uniref:Class I SAM-dependent methyltransferase n=1 Tax=Marinigracilibium pacificum TaxID=2729599 RepID=A0A848J499_9BACT|nr:class I SAM-dependent methyltransferase [Marinigracilibium pacificum]NMM50138.1 class I SAM-dependent methyltransferase [Marinigracilibium pacificum]
MKDQQDHFSEISADYAKYRPNYPQELYKWLFEHCTGFYRAWDAACGTGQVASELSKQFSTVYANDISEEQIENAPEIDNIVYKVGRAEESLWPGESIDLITTAQALHWFDLDAFFEEVHRVATENAIFAAWGYNLIDIQSGDQKFIDEFYHDLIGPYWPEERKYVDNGYQNIKLPIEEFESPLFEIHANYSKKHLLGYISTWSAVKEYKKATGTDPMAFLINNLSKESYAIKQRIFMRAGRLTI